MAIIGVVVYHAFKLVGGWTSGKIRGDGVDWFWWPLGGGRLGVDLFFVLSGFLLWFSWQSIQRRTPNRPAAVREFVKGRVIRIIPPYYAMLAVYVPLFAPELLSDGEGLWHLFLFLSVQQFNEPRLPDLFNIPLWTLTVEVQFYVVMPVVAWVIRRTRPVAPLLAALALTLWWVDNRGTYPTSWLLGRADQFVAGMAAAALVGAHLADDAKTGAAWIGRTLRKRSTAWGMSVAGLTIALYHGSTLGLPRGHRYDEWVHPAMGLILAGLVAHLVLGREEAGTVHRSLESAGLRLAGHLSYGIYLWHFPIYDHLLSWTDGKGAGLASWDALFGLFVATVLTLAVAVASYTWVERPLLERKVRSSISGGEPSTRRASSGETSAGRGAGER